MKILILCHNANSLNPGGLINNISDIYAYFFGKYLAEYKDCIITYKNYGLPIDEIKNMDNYDFCFVTMLRGIILMNYAKFGELRKKIKYSIITICGSSKYIGNENLLIFMLGKVKPKTMRVHWGADFSLLKPLKTDKINIIIDHKYYGPEKSRIYLQDKTEVFIKSLLEYKKTNPNIIINHIGKGKINEVTDSYAVEPFKQGTAMDFRKLYQYFNGAHIYIVTHFECMGLSVIESAAAGALIVEPNGYINKEIINKLHHVSIKDMNNIDWNSIINQIDINKSIRMANFFSYLKACAKLYSYFKKVSTK